MILTRDSDERIIQYAQKAGVQKIVALSNGAVYPIENALCSSNLEWAILHSVEFMKMY